MEALDTNIISDNNDIDKIVINKISVNKFIVLSIITFGLYEVWWVYKAWRFFQDKEKSDTWPAMRTILSIFFLVPLFMKIIKLSKNNGYEQDYMSGLLFIGYFITCLLAYLPEPFFLIAIFSFVFLIPPFKALNFAIDYCEEFKVNEQQLFNGRQIFLLIVGGIFWALVLIGLVF
jgi:hypothetical protein